MYVFLVEDGTGVTDATSYATTLQVDSYADFWEYTSWSALDDAAKEKLLMKATRLLDDNITWRGKALTTTQGLLLPKKPYRDTEGRLVEGIPDEVIEAVSEIAIILETSSIDDMGKAKVLLSQEYGDSAEEYATPYTVNASNLDIALNRIYKRLSKFKIGGSSFSQVTLTRG